MLRPDSSIPKVIAASAVGTMIEWYDFYIFGSLATVISPLFYRGHHVRGWLASAAGVTSRKDLGRSELIGSSHRDRIGVLSALFLLQLARLTIGITRDYQRKHEDNNALHATFARSHLRLVLETTRGQNYFYSPASDSGGFYPNHPPGPGLLLALVYGVTGVDRDAGAAPRQAGGILPAAVEELRRNHL